MAKTGKNGKNNLLSVMDVNVSQALCIFSVSKDLMMQVRERYCNNCELWKAQLLFVLSETNKRKHNTNWSKRTNTDRNVNPTP